ncbi:MAG TPA: hypothetical protein VFV58_30260 [Blastocatellia bacterium]|nr:hypothetical protein [Blastocatellia bacterium]
MRRLITHASTLTALLLTAHVFTASASYAQKEGEKSKSGNDQVKLYSDAVEVVEVSDKAEKCSSSGGATFLRLRVKSESPVDVRLHSSTRKGSWAFSDFLNKKSGDEITSFECFPKARFKVQTRPAGSDKWPSI